MCHQEMQFNLCFFADYFLIINNKFWIAFFISIDESKLIFFSHVNNLIATCHFCMNCKFLIRIKLHKRTCSSVPNDPKMSAHDMTSCFGMSINIFLTATQMSQRDLSSCCTYFGPCIIWLQFSEPFVYNHS